MNKQYLIINFFGSEPSIVTNEEGKTLYFDTKEEAEDFADNNLQAGYCQIVDVSK